MAREDVDGEPGPMDSVIPLYRYRFGTAEFDAARFELRVGGLLVEIQQKPLQMLALLLATPREMVSKETLLRELWKDRVTGDAVLNNAASKLRAALGADNSGAIVTVPRQGYRFEGSVDRVAVGSRQERAGGLKPGLPVPGRESYLLKHLLGSSHINQTWLARHPKTGDRRVFKFAADGERLADLKREVTLYRVLKESLGDHPGIVQILDWNFERPPYWLECNYAGQSLDAWAGDTINGIGRLVAADRAVRTELFLQLADAVASAHSVGILHKDLKPSNAMIEGAGERWQVRLTDFGSGRLLEPEQLERLHITQLGMTIESAAATAGTLFYMAPEIGRGETATVQSDVYSLGIILYQLLAGDLRRPLASGWERDIDDELLREDIAAATDVDSQHRLESAAKLAARVRNLEPRRAARAAEGETAARAVEAQRRLTRVRERRPWLMLAMLALTLGAGTSFWLYLGQRRTTAALTQQVQVSQALNRLLREDLIGAADARYGGRGDITVADALMTAAGRIDERFGTLDPTTRGSLHAAMQTALSSLSRATDALAAGRRALAALQSAPQPNIDAIQAVRLQLAFDLYLASKFDEARTVLHDIDSAPSTARSRSPVFRAQRLYVSSCLSAGNLALDASQRELEQAFALIESLPPSNEITKLRSDLMLALGDNLRMLSRYRESEAMLRRTIDEDARRFGPDANATLVAMTVLANTLSAEERQPEAQQLLERTTAGFAKALGPAHRYTLAARNALGAVRYRLRDYVGAAEQWEQVRLGHSKMFGGDDVDAISAASNEGMAFRFAGQPERAEPLLRDALEGARRVLKTNDAPQVQTTRYSLADCLLSLHRADEVATLLDGLSVEVLNLSEPESDWPARLDFQRARLAMERGDRIVALTLMQRAAKGLAENGDLNAGDARSLIEQWSRVGTMPR